MDRRRFFKLLGAGLAVASTDPERLLPKPGILVVPEKRVIALKALVSNINYSIFDIDHTGTGGQFAYLEAKDIRSAVDMMIKNHDAWAITPEAIVVSPEIHEHMMKVLKPPSLLERLFGWRLL